MLWEPQEMLLNNCFLLMTFIETSTPETESGISGFLTVTIIPNRGMFFMDRF